MANEPHLRAAVPVLPVDDLSAAIAWYRDRLGFDLAWTWGDPVTLASIYRDEVELNLTQRGPAGPAGAFTVYVQMVGVDAFQDECERRGAAVAVPIGDRSYGMRHFGVLDPSGNKLDFGEPLVE